MSTHSARRLRAVIIVALTLALMGCSGEEGDFDAAHPESGPGKLVGNGEPITDAAFPGGSDPLPAARSTTLPDDGIPPTCDDDCLAYCDGLGLQNPVNKGLCPSLWGIGLATRSITVHETCRRLFADMIGRFPTHDEVLSTCEGRPWGEVVKTLIDTDDFVRVNQRRWADAFLYNNQAVSVLRIFDMDELVGKLYRGLVAYDEFASVASAHPVVTRRFATPGDRAESVFRLFMRRPPLGNERSDLARLYRLWSETGYYDHPQLGMRLPDAFIQYQCINEETGAIEPGECTSVLYGYNSLVLSPDIRAREGQMWSGLLTSDEWQALQLPGQLLSRDPAFWEKAVDDVLHQYLGYDLGQQVPDVRQELVEYLLANNGDIRALHFAVATSAIYLQSAAGETPRTFRWTHGPLKQADAEVWIDSINSATGNQGMGQCDHRVTRPGDLIDAGSIAAIAMLENSDWSTNEMGELLTSYRDLARNLGGCPENEVGGRFRTVSILTTATQLSFVAELCNPALEPDRASVSVESLLPADIGARRAVDAETAEQIVAHQTARFFSRGLTEEERFDARKHGESCASAACTAEEFARPACFALLSSSEMLFY